MKTALSTDNNRMVYIDNIRILLVILVIIHHIAVAYGGSGGWPVKEAPSDGISPILFSILNGVNQSFFMSFFFLLSGFFVPLSFDKKGIVKFVIDKMLRLGIPLLFFVFLLSPFTSYLVMNLVNGKKVSFFEIIQNRIIDLNFSTGHLWFVFALLLYTSIYVVFRLVTSKIKQNGILPASAFPKKVSIIMLIFLMSIGTIAARFFYPVGKEFLDLQLGHHVHYIICFFLGIIAYRMKWFDRLTKADSKLWVIIAVLSILVMPVMTVLSGVLTVGIDVFLGGFHWQAYEYALWESIACVSIIIAISYIFKSKYNKQNRFLRMISSDVFAVYIFHQIIIVLINILLIGIEMPTAVKFFLVLGFGLPLCFFTAHMVRKIPYVNEVV